MTRRELIDELIRLGIVKSIRLVGITKTVFGKSLEQDGVCLDDEVVFVVMDGLTPKKIIKEIKEVEEVATSEYCKYAIVRCISGLESSMCSEAEEELYYMSKATMMYWDVLMP